jgi:hypothetical protein
MLFLKILQEFALTPSGTDVFAVVAWDELILDEKVAATPRNYRSSGCDMRGDLLKCCSATGISVFSLYLQVDYYVCTNTSYIIILSQGKRINQNETNNSAKKQKK